MYNSYASRTSVAASRRNSIKSAARTAAVFIGLFIGTGSNAAPLIAERTSQYTKSKEASAQVATKNSQAQVVDLRSPSQHLENIRSVFSFPISEVASVFGVTRQSIYKWLGGTSAPEVENLSRISELSHLADRFAAEGVTRPGDVMRMKAFGGRSILDMMKSGDSYADYIPVLIEEAKAMDLAYAKSQISDLQHSRTSDWKSSISIPFSDEA